MNILVTGGAGYIGSIVSEILVNSGYDVIILDNLQQGHIAALSEGVEFVQSDLCDADGLDTLFNQKNIDTVMHMAGETVVGTSVTDPKLYFRNNIAGGINLLDAMLNHKVQKIVFSSSAAVYGEPLSTPIDDDQPKLPVNSYGETKLMFEQMLKWYGKAYGLKHISLRYFNAAGASNNFGEAHEPETHLIPNVLKAAVSPDNPVSVYGTDYPSNDGSCVRDYVHVIDIAQAHILAMEKLDALSGSAYNLGSGKGYSVLEVVDIARQVTGVAIPVEINPRRDGDPAVMVADSSRARSDLGWKPEYPDLKSIVESAWEWIKKYPSGYEE